ncbi:MAG: nucleotide exchange factor GrpE [Rikenellaceae bacterium]
MSTKDKNSENTEVNSCENQTINQEETTIEGNSDNLSEECCENDNAEQRLTDELNEIKDKYIRLNAEFDNYRKRTLKEKMDLVQNGGSDVLKSILTVMDDFDRAEAAMADSTDIDAIKQGNKLIHNKLSEILKQKGLKEITALGEEFDTDLFEAIVKIPVEDEAQKGKIVDVIEKGYMLNDKVLRFAKVVVGE